MNEWIEYWSDWIDWIIKKDYMKYYRNQTQQGPYPHMMPDFDW